MDNPAAHSRRRGYRPADPIAVPPIYRRPLHIAACLRWFWRDLVFPYGIFYLGLAAVTWQFLTPDPQQMTNLRPGWMIMIWLRNAVLLSLVAGGLHGWLYIKRRQNQAFKYDPRWPATGNRTFLWGDQVKDNMFWSLASGSLIWSLYEAVALWWLVPAHPIIAIAAGFYFGLGPAFSHSGFEQVILSSTGKQHTFRAGDYFHQLHHRYFEVNYGNTPTPLDQLFGTWHDGSDEAHARFVARRNT